MTTPGTDVVLVSVRLPIDTTVFAGICNAVEAGYPGARLSSSEDGLLVELLVPAEAVA